MKVAIYSRVSTHDQDEQLQVPRLRDFCQRLGYEIYQEYSDVASGKNANRPGWKALLSDARRREFDAVIVVKLDRIMRSLTQLLDVLNDFEKRRISIITLDQGTIDMSSANSRLQISIIAMVAEWEREIIGERTREALRAKKARGEVLGRSPAKFNVRMAALMRIDGKSWKQIAERLGVNPSTLKNHRKEIEEEMERIKRRGYLRAGPCLKNGPELFVRGVILQIR